MLLEQIVTMILEILDNPSIKRNKEKLYTYNDEKNELTNDINKSISNIDEYGGLKRGEFLINKDVKLKMKEMLKEIESGSFVSEWDKEKNDNNSQLLNEKRAKVKNSKIEKINKKMIKILFDK